MSKLRPLGDKILVKRLEAETKTKSGIVLPDSAKERPQRGTIISLGPSLPWRASTELKNQHMIGATHGRQTHRL